MKTFSLTLILTGLTFLQFTDGLQCLRCNAVLNPLLCTRIKLCEDDEVCLTAKYITGNKETLYNVGCFPKSSCQNATVAHPQIQVHPLVTHLDPDDHLQCSYCCTTDACNQHPCGNIISSFQRGPICYDCAQTRNPATCSFVRTCEQNEVCRIHENSHLGMNYFTSSCATKSDCQVTTPDIFGRRRQANRKTECCATDLCNGKIIDLPTRPEDCSEIKRSSNVPNGVYWIYPGDTNHGVRAYCDMTTNGGGWTVLLARSNDSFNGNRSWNEFKTGFGSADGNYYIGNENIHLLTYGRPSEVYFKLQAKNESWFHAIYDSFSVGPETEAYRLHFNGTSYKGTAGDSLYVSKGNLGNLNNMRFSTYDRDYDTNPYGTSCANIFDGGWWYNHCHNALLTSMIKSEYKWDLTVGYLKASVMMIRPMLRNRIE